MEKQIYSLFNQVKQTWCVGCDGNCVDCGVSDILNQIKTLDLNTPLNSATEKCSYCWDEKKKKDKEIFYFDSANNMRISDFCPACGRKY